MESHLLFDPDMIPHILLQLLKPFFIHSIRALINRGIIGKIFHRIETFNEFPVLHIQGDSTCVLLVKTLNAAYIRVVLLVCFLIEGVRLVHFGGDGLSVGLLTLQMKEHFNLVLNERNQGERALRFERSPLFVLRGALF